GRARAEPERRLSSRGGISHYPQGRDTVPRRRGGGRVGKAGGNPRRPRPHRTKRLGSGHGGNRAAGNPQGGRPRFDRLPVFSGHSDSGRPGEHEGFPPSRRSPPLPERSP